MSAFCNAGFDLEGNFESIIGYRSSYVISLTIAFLVLAGALSFLVVREAIEIFQSLRHKVRRPRLSLDAKLVLSGNIVVFLVGFLAMIVLEWNGMLGGLPEQDRLLSAVFQALAGRTSGFSTVDWTTANSITEFVWLATMMVGGASGSTAGGVKIATVAVVFVAVISTFRGDNEPAAYQRRISPALLMRSMSIIAAFLLIHFVGTILLAFIEYSMHETDTEFNDMLFDSMSALATVGVSTGITPGLSDLGKTLLCVLMFVGRLGPLTLGYALQMRTHPRRYRFPVGDVRIG
ncbi:MAG: potassium transporter TrkG [Thermomicrobiales bacterium]